MVFGVIAGLGALGLGSAVSGYLGARESRKAAQRAKGDFMEMRKALLTGEGGFNDQLAGLRADPNIAAAQQAIMQESPAIARQSRNRLMQAGLASTTGAQVAALEAARAAGASRRGLAFGGGASAIAAQAARATAPQQTLAYAQAMQGADSAYLTALGNMGNFALGQRSQELALRQQAMMGVASLAGGAQSAAASARNAGIGSYSRALSAMGGAASGAAALSGAEYA